MIFKEAKSLEYTSVLTVFQKGMYPTKKDAEQAINAGSLYVYEIAGNIAGSIIANKRQPSKYEEITWTSGLSADEVMVLHLLLVRPSMAGKGIASSLVGYTIELAKNDSCLTNQMFSIILSVY